MDEPRSNRDSDDAIDVDLDAHLDQVLRAQLERSWDRDRTGDPAALGRPEQVLAQLQPRFTRAKRVRRAQLVGLAAGPLALVAAALVMLPGLAPSNDGQATVAGQPDDIVVDEQDDEQDDAPRATIEVTGTTEPGNPGSGSSPPETGQQLDERGSTTLFTSSNPGSSDRPTSAPTTAPSDSTDSVVTSTSVPGSVLVDSDCGAIVVAVIDSSVELVDTLPLPGYDVDVKSAAPEVEVSFEGRSGHCELNAEYERGALVTSNEDDDQKS